MIEAPLIVDLEELEVLQTALQKLPKSDSKSQKVSLLYNKIVSIKETICHRYNTFNHFKFFLKVLHCMQKLQDCLQLK